MGVHLEGRVSASDVLPEFAGWDARLAAIGAIRLASN